MKLLRLPGHAAYLVYFIVYFCYEVVRANIRVAIEVGTVKFSMEPGIRAVPLDAKTDFEIAMLSNLITLTPGTLSLDVSEDRRTVFVHTMYRADIEDFKLFEARFLKAVRWN